MKTRGPTLLSVGLVLALAVFMPFARADSRDGEFSEMKSMMKEMAKTIRTLQAEVAELKKEKISRKEGLPPTNLANAGQTTAPASKPSSQPSSPSTEVLTHPTPAIAHTRDRNTFLDDQWPAPRVNNAPIDPSLNGFIPIPGTNTIFKIGGSARTNAIVDDSNNGNPNEFIPSSFPVPGQPNAGGPSRSQVEAKGTRINFEVRRPMGEDNNLRIYYENDFFGDSSSSTMTYRVRHLYAQAWNVLVGQTFSNFEDIDAFPDVVNYHGPSGLINARQPQLRYTQPFLDTKLQLAVSIEQPDSQIKTSNPVYGKNASPVNRIPDLTAHVRFVDKRFGHLQLAGIYRYLAFDNDDTGQGVPGWGVSLSGDIHLFTHDTLTAQATYGHGIARYIQDPQGQNEDAALDDRGDLRALSVWGIGLGYTHEWTDKWRSTVSYGHANVNTEKSNGQFAFDHSNYASVNLVYLWSPTFRLGLEYLYGTNEVRNGASHDGQRVNFVLKYDLVK